MIKRYSNAFGFNYVTVASIIWCESGFDENAIHHNDNGSTDYGLLQNNSIHKKEALKMGYDITDPEQGLVYGLYLLKTSGIKHWSASLKCIGSYRGQNLSDTS